MTARLVAVGHVKPEHGTITIRFADSDPIWSPQSSGELPDPDDDLWRKQQIEDELAWGDL